LVSGCSQLWSVGGEGRTAQGMVYAAKDSGWTPVDHWRSDQSVRWHQIPRRYDQPPHSATDGDLKHMKGCTFVSHPGVEQNPTKKLTQYSEEYDEHDAHPLSQGVVFSPLYTLRLLASTLQTKWRTLSRSTVCPVLGLKKCTHS